MSTELLESQQCRVDQIASEIQLAKGQTYALVLREDRHLEVTVLSGCFWVTVEGDSVDYVADPDAPLILSGGGLVVLEGIDGCNVLVRSLD